MQDQYSIAEAKNKLPAIVHSVENGPSVKLTRHGRPVAVLVSIQEYERLGRGEGGFWQSLKAFRSLLDAETVEISDTDFDRLRDPLSGREVDLSEGIH